MDPPLLLVLPGIDGELDPWEEELEELGKGLEDAVEGELDEDEEELEEDDELDRELDELLDGELGLLRELDDDGLDGEELLGDDEAVGIDGLELLLDELCCCSRQPPNSKPRLRARANARFEPPGAGVGEAFMVLPWLGWLIT